MTVVQVLDVRDQAHSQRPRTRRVDPPEVLRRPMARAERDGWLMRYLDAAPEGRVTDRRMTAEACVAVTDPSRTRTVIVRRRINVWRNQVLQVRAHEVLHHAGFVLADSPLAGEGFARDLGWAVAKAVHAGAVEWQAPRGHPAAISSKMLAMKVEQVDPWTVAGLRDEWYEWTRALGTRTYGPTWPWHWSVILASQAHAFSQAGISHRVAAHWAGFTPNQVEEWARHGFAAEAARDWSSSTGGLIPNAPTAVRLIQAGWTTKDVRVYYRISDVREWSRTLDNPGPVPPDALIAATRAGYRLTETRKVWRSLKGDVGAQAAMVESWRLMAALRS